MNIKRMFLPAFLFMTIMFGVTSLLVPKGLSQNIIEDLESNYHSIKSLSQKAAQLKNLLPDEDFSLISTFLDDFKNYIGDYKSQENRSGLLLQKISIKLHHIESEVNPNDDSIFNEKLLKDQTEDLRKLVQELETKIDGVKADPMMFTKEKADSLYKLIQVLKEKYSPGTNSLGEFYAAQEAKKAKMEHIDQLDRQKRELEAKIEDLRSNKQATDFSLRMNEDEIGELNKKLEEVKKQIEDLERPKHPGDFPGSLTASNKVFHYIFLVDTSIREESQSILEQIDSNIEALKASRESKRDVFSLIAFDKETHVLAERLPIDKKPKLDLRSFQSESRKNYFEKGLEKVSQFLKNSRDKEENPVVILYTDGMRWYYESEPALEGDEGSREFFWEIWNEIVNWFSRIFGKRWFLRPIKENDIHEIKKQLADFSERFLDRNLTSFISGTTMQNEEILRNFAKALNRNEIVFQTTIGENYEYFNLAKATGVFPQIFKTLSIAEKGPVSIAYLREQAVKKVQKEDEDLKKDEQNFYNNKWMKEKNGLEKQLNELIRKKDKTESEIKIFLAEIEKLQPEINSIDSRMKSLNEEIRIENQKNFQREQAMKEREKLETNYAKIRTHLEVLEQLTKTVQARDHNILAIFEHVTTYTKGFLTSSERVLRKSEASDYDLLIAFYKDTLRLDGTDVENMEKICELWLGKDYDQKVARNFFMMISPRHLLDEDLKDIKEEHQEFYLSLRKKISAFKREQKMMAMSSQRVEIKSLFSQDMKKLMEKLNERIYMMY